MLILIRNLKILLVTARYHQVRFLTTRRPSSQEIRRQFVDYFVQNHDHRLVRSSPVVPFCDPTVAFVNAGMNQVTLSLFSKCVNNIQIIPIVILFIRSSRISFWEQLSLQLHELQTHRSVYAQVGSIMIYPLSERTVTITRSSRCWGTGRLVATLR